MTIEIETGTVSQAKPLILWDNILERGTVTTSSETADGAGANAYAEETTFDFWTPATVPANITADMTTATECDCVGIAAHTLGTEGSTVSVQSSVDNIAWTTRGSVAPTDDSTIVILFPAVAARYWRVLVEDDVASIGVIKLGKRLIIPTGVLTGHLGIHHAQEIDLLSNMSIRGQFLGNRVIKVGAQTSINFGMLETEFVENDMAGFETHYNNGNTFFYAGAPSIHPKDMGYCWRQERAGTLSPAYQEGDELMQVELQVSVYVE